MVTKKPFGCWQSPITAETTCASSPRFFELYSDGKRLVYSKTDPDAIRKGITLCDKELGTIQPEGYSPKSRVHEFGGGAFAVRGEITVFSNKDDGGVYFMKKESALTKVFQSDYFRFADFCIHPSGQWVICVAEEHTSNGIINTLCSLKLSANTQLVTLHSGYDFYSSPTFSKCGKTCAFISWDHPYMPWDRTHLWLAQVNDQALFSQFNTITDGSSSASHPKFSPDGTLFFLMDSSGFSQLYAYTEEIQQITDVQGDIATADWVFNLSRFDFLKDKKAAAILTHQGVDYLVIIDLVTGACNKLDGLYFNDYSHLAVCDNLIYTFAAASDQSRALVAIDPVSGSYQKIDGGERSSLDPAFIAAPIALTIPRESEGPFFAFFYPPTNPNFTGLEGEKAPLIIKAHSGPTSHSKPSLQMAIQFWTSRGFAFMEVNYRGSTGFGKVYRDLLYGNWSHFDSQDCMDAADFATLKCDVDPDRIFIKGSSAGGLTALSCLTKTQRFKGAICYYGISDMAAICNNEDHKFESHYTKRLLSWGCMDELKKQSALYKAHEIKTPTLFFQGGKDHVVPESQTRTMYNALVDEGQQTAFGYFPEEGHGFRSNKTLITCLQAELFFITHLLDLKIDNNKKNTDVQWNV